jgi:hypothetical protein
MPASTPPDGDILLGSRAIHAFLVKLGMPEGTDPYYLRRSRRWPIGNTGDSSSGGRLISSKRQLIAHIDDLTQGPPLGRNRIASKLRLGRRAKRTNTDMPSRRRERARKEATA